MKDALSGGSLCNDKLFSCSSSQVIAPLSMGNDKAQTGRSRLHFLGEKEPRRKRCPLMSQISEILNMNVFLILRIHQFVYSAFFEICRTERVRDKLISKAHCLQLRSFVCCRFVGDCIQTLVSYLIASLYSYCLWLRLD